MKRVLSVFAVTLAVFSACGGKSIRTLDDRQSGGDPGFGGDGPSGGAVGGSSFGGSSAGGSSAGGSSFGGSSAGGSSAGGSSAGGSSAGGSSFGGGPAGGSSAGGSSFGGGPAGSAGVGGAAGAGGDPTAHFRRGMNLGNRLDAPKEGDWGVVLHDTDFVHIASRGFDHVRLPVRFNAHAGETGPYLLDETFLARVDWAIEQALSNSLAIIVDFHHYEELHLDPQAHADRFLTIWRQLANRYRDLPPTVAFELLNEPNGALEAYWNDYAALAIEIIRDTNPTRLLIVDAAQWAGPQALGQLALPFGDPNLVASVHAYDPVLFTLQGADDWAGDAFSTTGVVYPGPPSTPLMPSPGAVAQGWPAEWFQRYNGLSGEQNPSSPAQVARNLAYASAYTATTGLRVYNGEWGCSQDADLPSRVRWMRDVRRESERLGMGWAVWDDGSNISLFNADTGTWNDELLATLFD